MSYMHEANAIAARLRGRASPPGRKATGPTPRNLDVMAYLRHFFEQNDQLPPVERIAKHFGWASMQSAHCHLEALQKHGLIERNAVGKFRFARGAR